MKSVSVQTLLPYEVILVDDFSTDSTYSVLIGLPDIYPSLRLSIHRNDSNEGAAFSRNLGIKIAKGEYIAFLDADDTWHPNKLALQVAWMNQYPEVSLLAHRSVVDGEEKTEAVYSLRGFNQSVVRYSYSQLLYRNRFSTPSVLMRSDAKFLFDWRLRYAEDYELWLRVAKAGGEVCFSSLPLATLYKPRFGAGGLSSNLFGMQISLMKVYLNQFRTGNISFIRLLLHEVLCSGAFIRRVLRTCFKRFG